jgi:hypothetical protein
LRSAPWRTSVTALSTIDRSGIMSGSLRAGLAGASFFLAATFLLRSYWNFRGFARPIGGEGVSQSSLKDNGFPTVLDQNPPFEQRPEIGFRRLGHLHDTDIAASTPIS